VEHDVPVVKTVWLVHPGRKVRLSRLSGGVGFGQAGVVWVWVGQEKLITKDQCSVTGN